MKTKKSWRMLSGGLLLALAASASAQTGRMPATAPAEATDPAQDDLICFEV